MAKTRGAARKNRKTLRKRKVRRASAGYARRNTRAGPGRRVQRGGNPKLLAPYFRAIANKFVLALPAAKTAYDEDLETTGTLPIDEEERAKLDLEYLRGMYDEIQEEEYHNNVLQANPHASAEEKAKSQRELEASRTEYGRLRELQRIQDAALDEPHVAHHEHGDIHIINVQFFNLVPLGISVANHPFDIRFTGRLRNRMKEGAGVISIEIGPAFRRPAHGIPSRFERVFRYIEGAPQVAIFDDNAFGQITAAFQAAEEAAYAEAEAMPAGEGAAAAFPGVRAPPPLQRFGHMSFESPFAAVNGGPGGGLGAGGIGPGFGGVARTLSYNSPLARTLSAPPSSAGSVVAPFTPPAHPGGAAAGPPPAPGRRQRLPHFLQATGHGHLIETNNENGESKYPEGEE